MSDQLRTRWDLTRTDDTELTSTTSIAIIGAGGHGREMADIARETFETDPTRELCGVADDGSPDRRLLARMGHRFLGNSKSLFDRTDVELLIGIGDPKIRERIDRAAPERAGAPLLHPTATVGTTCMLAPGVVLAQQATVTTNVRLGRHTHLNVAASVSHDCVVGDYVTICPGVRVTGNVTIGDRVFVGTGAVIIPGVHIGSDVMIGAGAVVCRDVPAASTVRGVPAR